jgi:hypothetical protein
VSAPATLPPARSLRIVGREYPVVLPTRRDPRLHLALVITTLQVLGQTSLGFELSIPQILASILTCAVIETAIVFRRQGVLAWPASALLTGNGVAFILRVNDTPHGDWWSFHGVWIFAATAAVSIGSKHLVRYRDRHIFNPSNFGLVACFLLLGTTIVNPLDFWWGPMHLGLAVALLVIATGAVVIVRRVRMVGAALGFWITFALGMGLLAVSGHSMTARWHVGPVQGWTFWWTLVSSPEVLIFLCFMITDLKTAPEGRVARILYGVAVAVVASLLIAPQTTEFETKVALLASLAVVCVIRLWAESRLPVPDGPADRPGAWLRKMLTGDDPLVAVGRASMVFATVLVLAAVLVTSSDRAATASAHSDARPRLPEAAVGMPAVAVDDSQTVAPIDRAAARQMTRDVVDDLVIQADALRARDAATLTTVADRVWLRRLRDRLRVAGRSGRIEVPVYDVRRVVVSAARRPHQGPPAILITLHGRVRDDAYVRGSLAHRGGPRPLRATFEIAWDGRHYLVVSDVLPPGFVAQ